MYAISSKEMLTTPPICRLAEVVSDSTTPQRLVLRNKSSPEDPDSSQGCLCVAECGREPHLVWALTLPGGHQWASHLANIRTERFPPKGKSQCA